MRKVHLVSGIEYLQWNRIVPSNKITICLEKTFYLSSVVQGKWIF